MLARLKAFLRVHLNPASFLVLAKTYRWICAKLRLFIGLIVYFEQRLSYIVRTLIETAKNGNRHSSTILHSRLKHFLCRHMKPAHLYKLSLIYKRVWGRIRVPVLYIFFPLIKCALIIMSIIQILAKLVRGDSSGTTSRSQKEIEFYLKYNTGDLSGEVKLLLPIIYGQVLALKKSEAK